MSAPRIIRITECSQCPGYYRNRDGERFCINQELKPCPLTGIPDWCPLEKLEKGDPDESLA